MSDSLFHRGGENRLNLHTPLLDILSCEYPVLCAGMGGVARYELAAAVSAAGGLGCLGLVREPVDMIREQVARLRERTDRPFAVNIIPAATDRQLLADQVQCIIELKVPVVSLFWDVNHEVVSRFLEAGIVVMYQVGSLNDAEKALAAGADILIAQGHEAGGHVRGTLGTFSLLPQVADISPVPVVAAGGIVSGQGLAAALMLGAQGVWCGSAFLATTESNAHDFHKQHVIDANSDDTVHTHRYFVNWPENAPVRVLKNAITETAPSTTLPPTRQIGVQDGRPIHLYSTDSPLRGAVGELNKMPLYASQACGQINDICPAAERLEQFIDEANSVFSRFVNSDAVATDTSAGVAQFASSPCMQSEVSGDYAGQCSTDEVLDLLYSLLAAERAGAKICAFSLKQAGTGKWHRLLRRIHQDEVSSCRSLIASIRALGGEPHRETGDFLEKCMAVEDIEARLALLNKGQNWVVRKIDEVLPRIGQLAVSRQLKTMRDEHSRNIEITRQALASDETLS